MPIGNGAGNTEEPVTGGVSVGSQLLRPLSVPADHVYTFGNGIYGFPDATRFALLPTDRDGFFWLRSLDLAALTFLLVDPFRFVEGYSVKLDCGELGSIPRAEAEIMVLTTVTPPEDEGKQPTTNLQGPIALNVTTRRGKQIAIESTYGIRHAIDVIRRAEHSLHR